MALALLVPFWLGALSADAVLCSDRDEVDGQRLSLKARGVVTVTSARSAP